MENEGTGLRKGSLCGWIGQKCLRWSQSRAVGSEAPIKRTIGRGDEIYPLFRKGRR